jgi:predicted peroxiredoxin
MFSKKIVTGMSIFIFALLTTAAYAHSRNNDAAAFFFLKGAAISVRQVIENVQKEENGQVISFKIEKMKIARFNMK